MDWQPGSVRCRVILPTPDARTSTALLALHQTPSGRPDMSPLNLRRKIRLLGNGIGKDPAFFRRHSLLAPLQNHFSQRRMQGNIVLGVFGFDIIHLPVHDAALNEKLILLKIEDIPSKRRNSLTRRPRHWAIYAIVRYGSFSNAMMVSNWSTVRIAGRCRRFEPSFTRTNAIGF